MPVNTNTPVAIAPTDVIVAPNNHPFLFQVGGVLYAQFGSANLTVYKSVDSGVTWTTPDVGSAPPQTPYPNANVSSYFHGTTIYTAYFDTISTMNLCLFDTSTDTYSNVSISEISQPSIVGFGILVRSNGNPVFVWSEGPDGSSGRVYYSIFSGGVWSGKVLLSKNIASTERCDVKGTYVHSDDSIHVFYSTPFFTGRNLYYVSIDPSNVIGPIVTVGTLGATNLTHPGTIMDFGGQLIFAVGWVFGGETRPAIIKSDAIPATSFTITEIDAGELETAFGPMIVLNGGIYYYFYISTIYAGFSTVIQNQIRYFTTTDFSAFIGPTVYYDQILNNPVIPDPSDPQYMQTLSPIATGSDFSIAFILQFTFNPGALAFFLGPASPSPSPVVLPPNPGGGGPSTFGPTVSPFAPAAEYNLSNIWNHCLCRQYQEWNCINWKGFTCPTSPHSARLRFFKSATIPCPFAADGDVVALSFQVPVGYDAVITGVVNTYLASGFSEGSGDLLFRIKLSRYFAKDMGNITTTLGSLQMPYPTELRIESLREVRYIVNAPNTSGSLLPGVARILVQCWGYTCPQDQPSQYGTSLGRAAA